MGAACRIATLRRIVIRLLLCALIGGGLAQASLAGDVVGDSDARLTGCHLPGALADGMADRHCDDGCGDAVYACCTTPAALSTNTAFSPRGARPVTPRLPDAEDRPVRGRTNPPYRPPIA